jgi:hypothetical protein
MTTAADIVAALDLPRSAFVEQRVPKKLLLENGAPTAADRRRITEGIEELFWVAALKPTTVGIPAFQDAERAYLEIALLRLTLRPAAKAARLIELIHRAIPYPIFLIVVQAERTGISLAHLRWSQAEAGATVLESAPTLLSLDSGDLPVAEFLTALTLARQPRTDLFALYDGYIATVNALEAADQIGVFAPPRSREHAALRRAALAECAACEAEIARLRAVAAKEKQVARRVELNLNLQSVQTRLVAARALL